MVREPEQLAAREREQHSKWRAAEQGGARASEGDAGARGGGAQRRGGGARVTIETEAEVGRVVDPGSGSGSGKVRGSVSSRSFGFSSGYGSSTSADTHHSRALSETTRTPPTGSGRGSRAEQS